MAKNLRVLGAAGLLALLAACSPGGGAPALQQTMVGPPLSEAEAAEVIAEVNEAIDQAYRDLDSELLEEVAGGSLLQRSIAEIEQRSASSDVAAESREYTDPQFVIPRNGLWWMADAAVAGADSRELLTFAHSGQGQWLLVSAITLETDLPTIATDEHGNALTAPLDDTASRILPKDAAAAYTDLWATGGDGPGSPLAATALGEDIRERRSSDDPLLVTGYMPTTPESTRTWVLRTEEGGTVAVGHVAHTKTVSAIAVPGAAGSEYSADPRTPVRTHHSGEVAMWLPASDFPEILGAELAEIPAG
ncbi:hypothetical protein ACFC1B_07380 [Streptomyces xiamenensis]|uniref:hypothetical protein n=1 Tax=Streptomyces xiamenensis TaxID=408015 RepID=UPI0035D55415